MVFSAPFTASPRGPSPRTPNTPTFPINRALTRTIFDPKSSFNSIPDSPFLRFLVNSIFSISPILFNDQFSKDKKWFTNVPFLMIICMSLLVSTPDKWSTLTILLLFFHLTVGTRNILFQVMTVLESVKNNEILEADNLSFFPEYFDHGHQPRALLEPEEACPSLDYPFQKQVSVGPEHQAYVPEWDYQGSSTSLNQLDEFNLQVVRAHSSSPGVTIDGGYEENLMGTCILPMPDLEASANYCYEATNHDCVCPDAGSIRCIKQHVSEARLKLRENLGEDIFKGLGFCDMGEVVANKWTGEEEQAFHEVVLSNPVSLGKNFWDHLPSTFPSLTKKELVSYYFNVFMLQKRADQNRFDPLNIDSDDDEWQKIEGEAVEEDEDSAVESLTGQDSSASCQEDHAEKCNEYVEDEDEAVASKDGVDNVVHRVATDAEYEGDVDDFSGAHVRIYNGDCVGDLGPKQFSGIAGTSAADCDVQDDSCTSYEHHHDSIDCYGPLDMGTDGKSRVIFSQ
ncbi:hypothetical protein OIU84_028860 [Salix udensis]|uniref:Myb-like domain-containing protein n=1 Tax=Salix udensis TaxID=889485 RepID=A0AAD6KFU8_9ROSI|nr:hypothetical protein OIU84_028860 [Salix udensis]